MQQRIYNINADAIKQIIAKERLPEASTAVLSSPPDAIYLSDITNAAIKK
jgi:hypothetical protein